MIDKKKHALEMYMSGTATQTQIAAQAGISERTLYTWIKDNGWDRLRQASLAAPIMIADELCTQLINLQQSIAVREEGKQFPTLQEANITGKIIMSLSRLKNFPSISQSLQVLQAFRHYVRDRNKDAAWQIGHFMESFLEDRAKFGYVPSQPEYGINPVNPFDTENTTPATPRQTHVSPSTGVGNSQPEIKPEEHSQIIENEYTTPLSTSCRDQQKPEISGNGEALDAGLNGIIVAGHGKEYASSRGKQEGVCDGCLVWRSHEMRATLNNDISCKTLLNITEQPTINGNSESENPASESAQITEKEEVTQENTNFHHLQKPAISGNKNECSETRRGTAPPTNPAPHTHMSPPPGGGRVGLTVNWEAGPNPLPRSVIFTLPDGKKEEVPFTGLVEAQVKRSIGNQQLTPELYEAYRKAAEMTLATNFMDKRYGRQDHYRKAS